MLLWFMTTTSDTPKSPVRLGADRGPALGIYFIAMFLTWVLSTSMPMLSMITVAMAIAFPFLVYKILRNRNLALDTKAPLTDLWIQGIAMIAFGAILCALVSLVYFKWINPTFMVDSLQRMIDLYHSTNDPSLAEMARMSQGLLDNHTMPSSSTIVWTLWLFTVTSGSLLAGLMAMLVKLRGPSVRPRPLS